MSMAEEQSERGAEGRDCSGLDGRSLSVEKGNGGACFLPRRSRSVARGARVLAFMCVHSDSLRHYLCLRAQITILQKSASTH